MAKYLDQSGLQILWDQIKLKFVDDNELASALSDYEKVEDLQRDYANRTELATILSGYATDAELAAAIAGLANVYVKKEVTSADGKALIFNEADGGGAKFEHTDGTWSFAGVNNGGADGIAAQIYAVDATPSGHNLGSKIDVTVDGVYYTTGAASGARPESRDVVKNEIATKGDINEAIQGLDVASTSIGANETLASIAEADGKISTTKQSIQISESQVTGLATDLASKTDHTVVGTNGTAKIFNESDGGGAKFEHTDGSESFVGVNNGGKDGLMAQIYADKLVDGKWQGAKLDVTNTGMYYTVGNKSFAERAVADNELVVKKDIKDIAGGMHFIGSIVPEAGESLEQTIARLYATKGKSYADRKPGDIVIINTPGLSQEYICDSEKVWVELGSEGLYATKAELTAEEEARSEADAVLEAVIEAEENRATAAEATKVDKEVTLASGIKSRVSNNVGDAGACLKVEDTTNNIWSGVSVNNGGATGIGAQLYDVDSTTLKGTKIDVTKSGAFYVKGDESGKSQAERDVAANEIATKGVVDNSVATEKTRAESAESALSTSIDNEANARALADAGKLDLMPGDEYTAGNAYNLPYFFETSADANKVTVTAKTVTLDGNKTHSSYSMDVVAATSSAAGLMASADKSKLDGIQTLTEDEIKDICK